MTFGLSEYIRCYPDPQAGPCVSCGAVNYSLSMGGPGICPSCDCSPPSPRQIRLLREALEASQQEVLRLTRELEATKRG